ncbi:uncharacterized protein LOC120198169 [Hibiscus syriacus]|uniref:uncharacterized protein LOC120198169 n=1 Tax=Hibiscus syriacus TaxID=106335 RepID=UPI0019217262|nr:uncharacterized protein LOC120198169 [Hibiscus syriacus]
MAYKLIDFFKKQLGIVDNKVIFTDPNTLKNLLNLNLSQDVLTDLEKDIIVEEIKQAFFTQGNDKALGPDGYSPLFFKKTWTFIGEDVIKAVKFFFHNFLIHPAFNSIILALVPKITNPSKVSDYRPISCCSVVYKVITKIISKRLTDLLPDIITPNQYVFVNGRSIIDNSLLAQDLVKGYGRNSISPRCALKIDLHKALDSLNWGFIYSILKAIELPPLFIKWIEVYFSGARYSISFNGSLIGYFKGNLESVTGVIIVLEQFYSMSGLKLNVAKSEMFSAGISVRTLDLIKNSTGVSTGSLPVRYLGVPIITKNLTIKDCSALIDKIKAKIHQWFGKFLSYAGRLELAVINSINQLCSRFLWDGSNVAASRARVRWANICCPKSEGGLGLKDLKTWNKAIMMQLIRYLLAGDGSLWIAWTYCYVIKANDFRVMTASSSASWCFKRLLKLRTEALYFLNVTSKPTITIWEEIRVKHSKVPWHKLIWFPMHIPKFSIISWMAILDKLPTRERLSIMGITTNVSCSLCNDHLESRNHLFTNYIFASSLWKQILNLNLILKPQMTWEDMINWATSTWKGKSLLTSILKIAWCSSSTPFGRKEIGGFFKEELVLWMKYYDPLRVLLALSLAIGALIELIISILFFVTIGV